MSLTIYGASDDLVEVEGHLREEYQAPRGKRKLKIRGIDGEFFVTMRYTSEGTWSAEIIQPDEDVAIPWPVTIHSASQCAYSVAIEIRCPDDVIVEKA